MPTARPACGPWTGRTIRSGGRVRPTQPHLPQRGGRRPDRGAPSDGNSVFSNRIYDNRVLGIDLDDGVTANDDDDPDAGPNNLQNFTLITSATRSGGTTTITGTLNSTPDQTFTVQCFLTGGDAASDHVEGRTLLEQDTVTTGTDGDIGFSCDSSAPEVGQTVSATATNTTTGDTSEFAANRTVE